MAVLHDIGQKPDGILEFSDFLWDEDARVALNAAWVLWHGSKKELRQLQQRQDALITLAMQTADASLRLRLLAILERMDYTRDTLRTDFLDFCLERMTALSESSGTQTLCMKLACRFSSFYPELRDEFLLIVRDMEPGYYKPGLRSIRQRVLNGKYK